MSEEPSFTNISVYTNPELLFQDNHSSLAMFPQEQTQTTSSRPQQEFPTASIEKKDYPREVII